MSFKILLQPSGREFEAEQNETLLDAAMRSGVNLNYSCNNGSCGECKAKIIDGETQQLQHADYVFSEVEKSQEQVLLCSMSARSNMQIEALETNRAEDIPKQIINVRVAKIDHINDEYAVVYLRTPRSKTLRFLAGQNIEVSVKDINSSRMFVASCPCNGMMLQLHCFRDKQNNYLHNAFSAYAFDGLRLSENLEIHGPWGNFIMDEDSTRPIVLVAQDMGFAPMKSLIEHAIALDLQQSIHLYWVTTPNHQFYLENYCRSWEDALDSFVFIPLQARDELSDLQTEARMLDEILVRSPIESEIDLYISASPEFSDAVRSGFVNKGTPANRVFMAETLA